MQRAVTIRLIDAVLLGGLVGAAGAAPTTADAGELDQLRKTIHGLQQQVELADRRTADLQDLVTRLNRRLGENRLTTERADALRDLLQDVLSDADSRASLLDSHATAGWDDGFFFRSSDNAYRLNVSGQLQIRALANSRGDGGGSVDGLVSDVELRRIKLKFDGHLGTPRIEYLVQLNANRAGTDAELEEATLGYRFGDNCKVWIGRFQDRFGREQMMSSKRQQAVDRTAAAVVFAGNDGYVEGIGLEWAYDDAPWRLAVTLNDGFTSGATGGVSNDFPSSTADIAMTARADWKLAGVWAQAADVLSGDHDPGLHAFIGAGVHYEIGETGDGQATATFGPAGGYDSFVQWTVDGLVKHHGIGLMAAVYGWHFQATSGNALGSTDHYAASIQLGAMLVPDAVEPFARFEWIDVDSGLSTNDLRLLTAGINWYVHGHAAKVTADAVWAMDNVNTLNTLGTGLGGIGLLPDAAGEEGQIVGRLQVQLLF